MFKYIRAAAVGLILLAAATGCADLEVGNPNQPDRGRALKTASDMESLVGGSYVQWWYGQARDDGPVGFILSSLSFQHSAWPANFGQVEYSWLPRKAFVNAQSDQYFGVLTYPWKQNYKAIYAVAEGLKAFNDDPALVSGLGGADRYRRVQAYGKFMLGISHASLAILYDSAFIVDEKSALVDAAGQPLAQSPKGYTEVMAAALGYLDEAIALSGQGFTDISASWMSRVVTAKDLGKLSHSLKARYRAAVARTPEERKAVAWDKVLADLDQGLTEPWLMDLKLGTYPWTSDPIDYWSYGGWQQLSYMVLGMADQSGMYQKWLAKPVSERHHTVDGEKFLIVTPDTRFPRGTTLEEQSAEANRGTLYVIPDPDIDEVDVSENWGQPGRGTWRWGWYFMTEPLSHQGSGTQWPEVSLAELDMLRAEALYQQGGHGAEVAALINKTRVAAGLNPTDAAGSNSSCVPKLPDGTCGDLWEMLKWEKRIEAQFKGPYSAPWYFDGRGWGELYRGSPLQIPMPCNERQILNTTCYTFGGLGGNASTAGTSIYNWPHEG